MKSWLVLAWCLMDCRLLPSLITMHSRKEEGGSIFTPSLTGESWSWCALKELLFNTVHCHHSHSQTCRIFRWLLTWLLHKWREGYLLPTWAQKITCWHFNWMPVERLASYIFQQITSSLCVESMYEWHKKEFQVIIRAQVGSREPQFKN